MKGSGSTVYKMILRLMGDKLPEQTREVLNLMLAGNENPEQAIELMRDNCDFEIVAEIAMLIAILDPLGSWKWIDLLVKDFNLDCLPATKSEPQYDYRFAFGVILAIFKIANELSSSYPKAENLLDGLPNLLYKIIINQGCLIQHANYKLNNPENNGIYPDTSKLVKRFKSALTTEITKYIHREILANKRMAEIQGILQKLRQSKDTDWSLLEGISIGGLILDQICYAMFGSLGTTQRVHALQLLFKETNSL
ncbi:hypothetical protein JW977_02385 [Candidatus Falkowbacteria bacterium]|nr:hypothetical protein [Candidatus Falkowbacteria bacterium]